MKAIKLQSALPGAVLAIALSAAGPAGAVDGSKGDLQAKIEYCKNCHGSSGQGFRGFYPAPRLAGQTKIYLENQLRAIIEHRRDNPAAKMFMVHALEGLSPSTRSALASYFSGLNPPPVRDAPKNLAAAGKKIYDEGVPGAGVPPCAACHGPEGKGMEEKPRLAGQIYSYTVAQLAGWGKGYRSKDPLKSSEENAMAGFARGLSKQQSAAVAAYLSNLK